MTVGNSLNLSVTGVVTQAAAGTFTGSPTTQYTVQVGGASNTISSLASVGTTGHVLTSQGAGQPPIFSAVSAAGNGWVFLSSATASASATLDFTTSIDSTYNLYAFVMDALKPASDGIALYMRTSANSGSSWDSGVSDYAFQNAYSWGSSTNNSSIVTGASDVGNSTNEFTNGTIFCYNPSAAQYCLFQGINVGQSSATTPSQATMMGARRSAAAVNGVRFYFQTGNIASGTIKLYGCCKPS